MPIAFDLQPKKERNPKECNPQELKTPLLNQLGDRGLLLFISPLLEGTSNKNVDYGRYAFDSPFTLHATTTSFEHDSSTMGELDDARKALKKATRKSSSQSKNVSIVGKNSNVLLDMKSTLKSTGTSLKEKKRTKCRESPPASPKDPKTKLKPPKSPSKKKNACTKSKETNKNPFGQSELKSTGAFREPADSNKKPSKVFSVTKSKKSKSDGITVTREMKDYVQRLKDAGGIASVETTPRDNDLVAAMLHVGCNDKRVGEISIDQDPRFDHIANSAILDFAYGISTNFYLTRLEIRHVELGNGFLSALAESVVTNWTLEYLDLSHNSFTSDAIVEFCVAMKKNKNLRYVDLREQNSPIQSQQEKQVLAALSENSYIREYFVEFRTAKCQAFLDGVLTRNQKKDKHQKDREKKITAFLAKETERAEREKKERDQEEKEASKELDEKDCEHFYELSNLAKKYKVDLNKTEDSAASKSPAVPNFLGGGNSDKGLKLSKALNLSASAMKADGSFLTPDFIAKHFVEDKEDGTLTFEFTNQFKIFQRFSIDDPARTRIVEMLVEAILDHPRADEINVLNMANTCIADDFLCKFCDRCFNEEKLKNVHRLNLETNFIKGNGFIALSKCIANPSIWKYLNSVKVDNQKSPSATQAEVALARALCVNRTVIRFSLRVRNLRERERINRCIQRNIDFLRQARQLYLKKTGKLVKRARNKMEKLIDSIMANDPATGDDISIVGDQTFLALNRTEIMNAAACFKGNEHVKSVKLSLLKLDDKFAIELANSIEENSSIEKLVLDNNAIGSEGIIAIVSSVARNKTISELQVRHQSKPLCTTDEEKLAGLLESNDTLMKFGVDLRSGRARNELDRKLRQNQEKRRKARVANKGAVQESSKCKIKSNEIEVLIQKVVADDEKVKEVLVNGDKEFVGMSSAQKKGFFEGLGKNTHVKRLVLDGVGLDNGFAEDLAVAISSNKTMKHISLNKNEFTSPGILAISKACTKNKRVKSFSILKPRFKMTSEDAELFVKAMEKKSSLRKLDIDFRDDALAERANKIVAANKEKK